MLGDVEMAHAQREIDRVGIFERGGERGQVRRERHHRDQANENARQVRLGGVAARR